MIVIGPYLRMRRGDPEAQTDQHGIRGSPARLEEAVGLASAIDLTVANALIAPVSLHRFLFRRHARRATVEVAHRLAQIGISLLGLSIFGVILLIFDVVVGFTAGVVAGLAVAVVLVGLWVVLPLTVRHEQQEALD